MAEVMETWLKILQTILTIAGGLAWIVFSIYGIIKFMEEIKYVSGKSNGE